MTSAHDDDQTKSHLMLQTGTRVDRYEIIDRLGAGGMGEVYLALDTSLDRKVALKFLPDKYLGNEEVKLRFVREAKAAAGLNHPNIITVHEVSEYQARPYFSMEHVEGEPLQNLCRDRRMPIDEVIRLSTQIVSALQHAHEHNIVHRDIKSSNIVIDKAGRPRVIDFGLAAVHDEHDLTKMGSTIGTVAYMSPEQTRGEAVDARSDLFSFGVVLYEMITGRTPFRRDSDVATMQAVATEPHDPASRYAGRIPDDMERIVSKLLEKDKKLRYQSAAEVVADLNRLTLDISGRSTAAHAAIGAMPKGKPRLGWTISSTVVLLLIVLALVFKPWKLAVVSSDDVQAGEPRMAVMYFNNLSEPNDSKRLGEIAASLVITDLSESEYVKVVSSQRLHDILNLLGQGSARTVTPDIATEVAKRAEAKWILNGDILQTDPFFLITSQIVEVGSGTIVASQRIQGAPGQTLFELVDSLTVAVKSDLSLPAAAMQEADPRLADVTTGSTEAYRLLVEARDEMMAFRAGKAIPLLQKAIEIDSTFAMAYFWLSIVADNNELARRAIDRAHELRNRVTALERAYIEVRRREIEGEIDQAIDSIETALKNHPDDKTALIVYQRLTNTNLPEKAKDANLRLIAIDPLYRLAYNSLAYLYTRENNVDSAIWAINEYIRLGPDDANPYDTRGELYMLGGKLPEAIESFKTALQKDSTFQVSRDNLVTCYIMTGAYEKADSLIRIQLKQSPAVWAAFREINLTRIPDYRGRYSRSRELLSAMLAVDTVQGVPEGAVLLKLGFLGAQYAFVEQYDSAVALLQPYLPVFREAEVERFTIIGYGVLGFALGLQGQREKSLEVLRGVRERVPFDPSKGSPVTGVETLVLAAFGAGEYDLAIEVLEYIESRTPNAFARTFMGVVEFHRKNYDAAIEHLQIATTRRDASCVEAALIVNQTHYWLGRSYEEAGWAEGAADHYRAYLERMKDGDQNTVFVKDATDRLKKLGAS